VTAYCASKAFGERAAWDWMKENKPNFTLTTICPPWIFGPYVEPPTSTKHLSESVSLLWKLVGADGPHPFDFGGFADSREVAEAHVRALEVPEAAGQRFWVGQGFQWQEALDVLREVEPQIKDRLPVGKPGFREDVYKVDGSKAERVLGIKYRTLGETIKDTFDQLLYAEQVESKA
jgi:NADPH-dependent methylglyoxal reductase